VRIGVRRVVCWITDVVLWVIVGIVLLLWVIALAGCSATSKSIVPQSDYSGCVHHLIHTGAEEVLSTNGYVYHIYVVELDGVEKIMLEIPELTALAYERASRAK
jgi:hypothetical protein